MKNSDLTKIPFIKSLQTSDQEKDIFEVYICDLMSWVLGHLKQSNTVLLTIINSPSVIAVASILDLSAIVFCEGVNPTNDIIEKAKQEHIMIFTTNVSTAKTAISIYESLL